MCTFNTQEEIFKALLEGKKLVSINFRDTVYIHLRDGCVVNQSGVRESWVFTRPKDWSIYQEPKPWYENIPPQGVLCWVSGVGRSERIGLVYKCKDGDFLTLPKLGPVYTQARPLTEEEVKKYILTTHE